MPTERLQKILSRAGVASRRHAEELIAAGLVTVNGQVAKLGDQADPAQDSIKVEGRRVPPPLLQRYLVVNKPAGTMSTVSDPEGRPTVIELVPPGMRKALVPVGRLDFNTEGLLLLTTDGEWAQRIAHPRYGCLKVYEAKIKGRPEDTEVERLRRGGMWIEGKRTGPAEVRFLRGTGRGGEGGNTWWEVVLGEGRTRQVREMFFRIGHPVQRLRRVAIGPLRDPRLEAGQWRELSEAEVELLRRAGKVKVARSPQRRQKGPEARRATPGKKAPRTSKKGSSAPGAKSRGESKGKTSGKPVESGKARGEASKRKGSESRPSGAGKSSTRGGGGSPGASRPRKGGGPHRKTPGGRGPRGR